MTNYALDLDAELKADAEIEKNDTHDAAARSSAPRIDKHIDALPKAQRAKLKKVAAIAKRALKTSDEGDTPEGARLAFKALDMAPDIAITNHMMGLMLFRLGRLSRALEFYERAWKIDPRDPEVYQNLGLVAWKLDMLEGAEKFYRLHNQIAPERIDGTINLAGVLRDQGKFDDAVEILRIAIYSHPEEPELWNSLGTVLMESGDPEQASTFYTEALRLKPGFGRAHNNMANVYELLGEPEKAIEHFTEALKDTINDADEATMRHGLSMALLACGRLEEGWAASKIRLDPNNAQATLFAMKAPMWEGLDPAEIKGKTVVYVGEQGLGDEVLFMNTVPDLLDAVGPDGDLRIACEYRLKKLVARSFPGAKIFHHMSATIEGRDVRVTPGIDDDADYWTPMATPLRAFRKKLSDFPQRRGFLKPDPERQAKFRKQLAGFGPGLKVGILWKSLKMTARRSRFFSAFDAWKGVLNTPGVDFINLQYGEVEEELALAKDRFGITVHQPEDIDLKMDLDGVAALSSACDLVIGPMNATTNLAAASGGNVWFIHARSSAWTLLGSDQQHWYPGSRSFYGEGFQDWDNTMARIADALAEQVKVAA